MGEHEVRGARDEDEVRAFTRAVIADLRALEELLAQGGVERGAPRVGLEQEMFLVDAQGRAACVAEEVLARAADPRLTTEIARFNLEANLAPRPLGGDFLRRMEEDVQSAVDAVDAAAQAVGARVLLVGILPTLAQEDLSLDAMARAPRYRAMNEALRRLRGADFSVALRGADTLEVTHDSIMLESANTSVQLHLQVDAESFAPLYNLAQLVSAPLLAAAAGSPLLFGRRLWHETRIALFERATDARSAAQAARGLRPRVSFGGAWVERSPLELFRDDALRFPVILVRDVDEEPSASLREGRAPALRALALHNGTVWRWNRACYGVTEGRPHLRIENRVLPAGPTVLDEVANAALFYGLMEGLRPIAEQIPARLAFEDARASFFAAARHGLGATLTWLDGRSITAPELLETELFPAAERGLAQLGVPAADVERYLGTVRERVRTRRTAAQILLDVFAAHRHEGADEASLAATRALLDRQRSGSPAHAWPAGEAPPSPRRRRATVADVMVRDVFTVRPEDVLDLAASVMEWRHVRHVPVEDAEGRIVGLVSPRALLHARGARAAELGALPVDVLMDRDPAMVPPSMPLREAAARLLATESGCLLVTEGGRLAGIVTERDLVRALLEAT
jgi:CBS domain-containing protein